MVKEIPIPKEIHEEFQPFIEDKESLAKLFDSLDFCVLCNDQRKNKDMPSQTKGQNSIDRYFVKINSEKNSSSCESEMGKKTANNNSVHNVSSSSDSETKEINKKSINVKNNIAIELDANNSDEAFQIEPTPSKPIIAAMNALGKLKQDIAKVTVDDNSSRDSQALVIDEEQLEPEKDSSPDIEETQPTKSSRKSNDGIQSSKNSKDKGSSSNNKPVNDSLNFSNLFNSSKIATPSQVNKRFSTSTPVEVEKAGKRKRTDDDESSDQPSIKKTKEKSVKFDHESWLESMRENDDMVEVENIKDGDCPLYVEDLESDDELYVVQCPKEVDLENFVEKKLDLNGETKLKLEVNGTNQVYECFSEKDTMGRHVNMILPSRIEEKFKFGVYKLNGSLVISESFDDPDDNSSDQADLKITVKETSLDSKKDLKSKELNESKEKSLEKVKKHRKKRDNSDIEQTSKEVMKTSSKEKSMNELEIKSERDSEKNLHDPSNEHHEFKEKNSEKIKKHKKKRDNADTVKEKIVTSLKEDEKIELEESVTSVKKKKKRKETSEEKIPESIELTSHSDADYQKVEKKKKRPKESEFSSEGVVLSAKEEKKIKKEKKEKSEERQVDQEALNMEVDEEIVTKKKKKKRHHDEAENIEPVTELKQLPVEILKQDELLEPQDSNSDGTVKKKKKRKDKEKIELIKPDSVGVLVESPEESVHTDETIIKKKKKKKHHDQVLDQPVIDVDAEEQDSQNVDEGNPRNHFIILSSFVETDEVNSKKKKKKKKKKEKEKSEN